MDRLEVKAKPWKWNLFYWRSNHMDYGVLLASLLLDTVIDTVG